MKVRNLKPLLHLIVATGLFCGGAFAGTFKTINIDGSFGDWAGVPLLESDPVDSPANVVDYGDIYVANDDNYLYIRFTLHTPANPFTSFQNIFIDADNDGATGFNAGGFVRSEMLIQGGAGYQQKNGGFN